LQNGNKKAPINAEARIERGKKSYFAGFSPAPLHPVNRLARRIFGAMP